MSKFGRRNKGGEILKCIKTLLKHEAQQISFAENTPSIYYKDRFLQKNELDLKENNKEIVKKIQKRIIIVFPIMWS